jgi:hypothetical protein
MRDMRQWRMGTLTLGFLLIALGCGFILSKLGIINSIVQILGWWPLAIILLGIEVLFGGFLFIDDRCKLKFDGFSVLAILFTLFICAGSFLVSALPLDRFNFGFPRSNIFYSDNSSFQKNLNINASGKENFVINNSLGSVQLQKASGNNIEVEAAIKVAYNDYEYAKSIPDNLIKVTEGNVISLSSDRGQFQNDKINIQSIDYKIKVPEKLNVEVINKFGKVEADSIDGDLKINSANGSINVRSVLGSLTIDNKFGDVIASNVKGSLKLANSNGKIKIENVEGSLTAENRFGDVELKNVVSLVDIKNENGAITFTSDKIVQNDVNLEGKFGSITLNLNKGQEGRFNLYSRHGSIKTALPISINKDNSSESTDTNIGSSKYQFNIKNENGSISVNKN